MSVAEGAVGEIEQGICISTPRDIVGRSHAVMYLDNVAIISLLIFCL